MTASCEPPASVLEWQSQLSNGSRYARGNDVGSRVFQSISQPSDSLPAFRCACLARCLATSNCSFVYLFHNGSLLICNGLRLSGPGVFTSVTSESWRVLPPTTTTTLAPTPPPTSCSQADLFILLTSSGTLSPQDWLHSLGFVRKLVDEYALRNPRSRFGLSFPLAHLTSSEFH